MSLEDEKNEYRELMSAAEPDEYALEEILAEYRSAGNAEEEAVELPTDLLPEEPLPTTEPPAETPSAAQPVPEPAPAKRPAEKPAQPAPSAEKPAQPASPTEKPLSAREVAARRWDRRKQMEDEEMSLEKLFSRGENDGEAENGEEQFSVEAAKELLFPTPRPVTLEEVVGSTVDAVMEETEQEFRSHRRGLFSKRKEEETEQLYETVRPKRQAVRAVEKILDEPKLAEAAADCREDWRARKGPLIPALITALIPLGLMGAEEYGLTIPMWTGDDLVQTVALLALVLISLVLCRQVIFCGIRQMGRKRFTALALIPAAAVLSALDCVVRLVNGGGGNCLPFCAVNCMALFAAQWGIAKESAGDYNMFHAAAMDEEPPYMVSDTVRGACKQRGVVRGFYTAASRENVGVFWQTLLMPVIFVAAFVFAGLTTLGRGLGVSEFLLHWSAILTAGATIALPLCWGLSWSATATGLHRMGCSVAGWRGAEKISASRTMILSDTDLFPRGTIHLNGVKVYGESLQTAAAYAAAMTRAAGCGLERLFDELAHNEDSPQETAENFNYYEEGGYSAVIHGETVLLGTATFMRKMDVLMPANIHLKTGVFLAVDGAMTAVFAVKYEPSENVEFALRMMRAGRITPILASRDPNITPALIKRKFTKKLRIIYPGVAERVAFSEAESDSGMPRAILLREGLLPYAEITVGSRRLCSAVRRSLVFSLLGSVLGTILTAYLLSVQAYTLLTPFTLEVFLLLWALPVLLFSGRAERY